MKSTIIQALNDLAKTRQAFFSEADFQFAFSTVLQNILGKRAKIYLERPVCGLGCTVDIWVKIGNDIYPIELKYATKEAEIIDVDGEHIFTKEQVAYDVTRYLYLYDIHRLENIRGFMAQNDDGLKYAKGYAIILTCDRNYYNLSRDPKGTLDETFRIHQGNTNFNPTIQWNNVTKPADHWTIRQTQYNETFTLQTAVNFDWVHFSTVMNLKKGKNGQKLEYKYLINEIY